MIEKIKKYIEKDPISFIHIKDLLDRDYTIIYASDNGFIIHDDKVNFIYISFSDEKEMKEVLSKTRYEHYLAYDKAIVDFYGDNGKTVNLYQWAYLKNEKFNIEGYDIRVLGLEYVELLNRIYKALGPGEENIEALKRKEVLGIFENNKLAGFVGRHPEGCVGMLLVFKEYRRKGYGIVLLKAMINKLIDENQRVFGEIVEGNDISSELHRKVGFVKGERKIYWLL